MVAGSKPRPGHDMVYIVRIRDKDSEGSDNVGAANVEDVPPPTIGEIKDAIKQLIKMGPDKLANCLHRLIAKIWDNEQLPEEWKDGVICPIYKKGDKLDCENYRRITVLNAASKVPSKHAIV